MPKRIPLFQIDQRPLTDIGGAVIDTVDDPAPAAPATLDAPTLSSLSASLARSATTPMALISAAWSAAAETTPERYVVQYATDSAFTVAVGGVVAYQTSAAIENLTTGTTYYVRVAAEYRGIQSAWSNVQSVATPADTTPPNPVTSLSASFINTGDLQISWTNSTSSNLKDTEVAIYTDNTKTTQLALIYVAAQTYLWTVAQNLAATSGAGDASVYVELRARSWGGIFSSAVSASATKAAPATPTVTLVKSATHQLVATISSARGVDVARYEFVFKRDGTTVATKLTTDNFALYELSAAGDAGYHSWTVVARAQDGLNQYSASSAASSAVVVDLLTLDLLREGLLYTDSDSNTSTTLDSLKDGTTGSGGVSYAA